MEMGPLVRLIQAAVVVAVALVRLLQMALLAAPAS
jgi:hypothetical protein